VWTNPDAASYLSTPVLDGGRMFGFSHRKKGQWFCVDAASGKTLWLSDGRQAENGAILAGAGVLFLLDTDGSMTVAAARPPGSARSGDGVSLRPRPGRTRSCSIPGSW